MKKILMLVLLSTLLVACGSSSNGGDNGGAGKYVDGTYTGAGEGRMGPIEVEVVVEGGKISSVVVTQNEETPTFMTTVEENLIPTIIENNTWEVDTVAGATATADAVMEAVEAALSTAKN